MREPRLAITDLPAETLCKIAAHLQIRERLKLAQVCKQFLHTTRAGGADLWGELAISFSTSHTLHSFHSWCRRSGAQPRMLLLQHGHQWQAGQPSPAWSDVVAPVRLLLPSLKQLVIRFEGAADTELIQGGASALEELGLYATSLTLTDALGRLPKLKDLSVESSGAPLALQSPASLPPSLTKLFAVESNLTEVPEALGRLASLESAYLSRNPLEPASLTRLAPLRLRLLSLISCNFLHPPRQLSALRTLRALYLDYNHFGSENDGVLQGAFSEALATLTGLQALGLSHNELDSWPVAIDQLAQLRVLYLESNPGIARLPAASAPVLARLHTISVDCSVLFSNAQLLRGAVKLEHLHISGSGLMWHVVQALAPARVVLDTLAHLHAAHCLRRVTFVVQTLREEVPSVEVAEVMVGLPQRCPGLAVEALDSEEFFGVTLTELDAMAAEEQAAAEQQGQAAEAAMEAD